VYAPPQTGRGGKGRSSESVKGEKSYIAKQKEGGRCREGGSLPRREKGETRGGQAGTKLEKRTFVEKKRSFCQNLGNIDSGRGSACGQKIAMEKEDEKIMLRTEAERAGISLLPKDLQKAFYGEEKLSIEREDFSRVIRPRR